MFLSKDVGRTSRGPFDDFWYQPVGVSTLGIRVSPATAIAVSTLYACCLVLGQSLAQVPLHLYTRLDRGRARAAKHPLYRLLHLQPNRWQTSYQWRQMMEWHLALRHNAYARILTDRRGRITELVPLHPDRVRVERFMGSDDVVNFRYRYLDERAREQVYVRGEILHVRGLSSDGIEGFSPLEAQGESIGEALLAQRYSARRLKNNAVPQGALEWQGHFKTDDDRSEFRASWQKAQADMNQGKVAVLERGMTWKDVGVKNTDFQYIETRKLKDADVARAFRMPPHKVGILDRATNNNIEHQGLEFVTDTMLPWYVNWEQELSVQLLLDGEQDELYAEFLVDGLMRGDSKSRAEYYGKRFNTGSMSPNDIRERENENPVDGGDRYFVPANMHPLDRADDLVDRPDRSAPGAGGPGGDPRENARAAELERAAASRVIRKEVAALRDIVKRHAGQAKAAEFYEKHVAFVAEVLAIDAEAAVEYCHHRFDALKDADDDRPPGTAAWIDELEAKGVEDLIALMARLRADKEKPE